MPQTVQVEGVGLIEFPDDMSRAQMSEVITRQFFPDKWEEGEAKRARAQKSQNLRDFQRGSYPAHPSRADRMRETQAREAPGVISSLAEAAQGSRPPDPTAEGLTDTLRTIPQSLARGALAAEGLFREGGLDDAGRKVGFLGRESYAPTRPRYGYAQEQLRQNLTEAERDLAARAQDVAVTFQARELVPKTEFVQRWEEAGEGQWPKLLAESPGQAIAHMFAESLPMSAAPLAAGVAGALTGGPTVGAAATGAGSFYIDRAAGIYEAAQEAGIDLQDPQAVAAAFQDRDQVRAWQRAAAKHAVPVAALDALSFGMAGKIIAGRIGAKLESKGAELAFRKAWAERPGDVLAGLGLELGGQGAAGGWGELLGQVNQGKGLDQLDTKAAAAEFLAELATGPAEAITQYRAAEAKARRADAPRRDDAPARLTPPSNIDGRDDAPRRDDAPASPAPKETAEQLAREGQPVDPALQRAMQAKADQVRQPPNPIVNPVERLLLPAPAEEVVTDEAPRIEETQETVAQKLKRFGFSVLRPLWEQTRDELEQTLAEASGAEKTAARLVFGDEGAKRYERLYRKANNTFNTDAADAAADELAEMESSLTPEQEKLLFGIGGPDALSVETVNAYLRSIEQLDESSADDLGWSMQWALSEIGSQTESDPASMSVKEQIAWATLKEAQAITEREGFDPSEVSNAAMVAAAKRFADPNDAVFILGRFLKPKSAPNTKSEQINSKLVVPTEPPPPGGLVSLDTALQKAMQAKLDQVQAAQQTTSEPGPSSAPVAAPPVQSEPPAVEAKPPPAAVKPEAKPAPAPQEPPSPPGVKYDHDKEVAGWLDFYGELYAEDPAPEEKVREILAKGEVAESELKKLKEQMRPLEGPWRAIRDKVLLKRKSRRGYSNEETSLGAMKKNVSNKDYREFNSLQDAVRELQKQAEPWQPLANAAAEVRTMLEHRKAAADNSRSTLERLQSLRAALDLEKRPADVLELMQELINEESFRALRERFPDITREEAKRMAPALERAMRGGDLEGSFKWKERDLNLDNARKSEVREALSKAGWHLWKQSQSPEFGAAVDQALTGETSRAAVDQIAASVSEERAKAQLRISEELEAERVSAEKAKQEMEEHIQEVLKGKDDIDKRVRDGLAVPGLTPVKRAQIIKDALVEKLERLAAAAPTEKEAVSLGKSLRTVTIAIPGDGEFTVVFTKENLETLLTKAKRIQTSTRTKRGKNILTDRSGSQAAGRRGIYNPKDAIDVAYKDALSIYGDAMTAAKKLNEQLDNAEALGLDESQQTRIRTLLDRYFPDEYFKADAGKSKAKPSSTTTHGYTAATGSPQWPGGPTQDADTNAPRQAATAPSDDREYSAFQIELPEMLRLAVALLDGKFPKLKDKLRALRGGALGVFRHLQGKRWAEIELRRDLFELITPEEKARLRQDAIEYAERVAEDEREIERIAKERYQHLLEEEMRVRKHQNPALASKVLAHEIGHLVDWLPDYIVSGRGNILGRIASLKKFLKHTLPEKPGAPGDLTAKERAKLRREAEKQLKAELGPIREIIREILIEEPIYKETGVTPEDVKALFGMAAREEMPDLYEWFARLSGADKKAIVKQAMAGLVDDRVKRFSKKEQIGSKQVKRTVREVSGRLPTKEEIRQRFRDLLRAEIRKRRLIELETIKAELEPLIAWSRGTEEMEDYFKSSEEMYAEAFNVFLNNPAAMAKRAPTYFKALLDYMESKPEVKEIYDQIQNDIALGAEKEKTEAALLESWRRADARNIARKQSSGRVTWAEFLEGVQYIFDRRLGPIYKAIRRKGRPIEGSEARAHEALGDRNYVATEHEAFLRDVEREVGRKLLANDLDWHGHLGLFMFYNHVFENRANIANPLGITTKRAAERLRAMQDRLGPVRWQALVDAHKAFRAIYRTRVVELLRKSGLTSPELQDAIDNRVFYATFQAVKNEPESEIEALLDRQFGSGIGGRIYRQVGNLGEINPPATATVLKALSLISAAHRNMAKRATIAAMQDAHYEALQEAEQRWTGKRREYVMRDGSEVGTVVYLEDGKAKAWYVPRRVADSMNQAAPTVSHIESGAHAATGVLRGAFTHLNPGFWPFAFARDMVGWNVQMPGLMIFKPWHYLSSMARALRPAIASFSTTSRDPVAKRALDRKMVISKKDRLGFGAIDDEYALEVASFGMNPTQWNKESKAIDKVLRAWGAYKDIGQVFERWHKIAGMLYLDSRYPDLPEWKKREIVRERAGSPDFLQKPGSSKLGLFVLFYNPWKEGIRSMAKSAKERPGEFAFNMVTLVALPTALQAIAAATGFGDDDLREQYETIPDYDLTNYLVIPLGWADEKKERVAYLRLPLWEQARIIHGMIWKGLTGRGQGVMSHAGGQVPGLNPLLTVANQVAQYEILGKNPYDPHRGEHLMTDRDFKAGGWDAQKVLLREAWNLSPGSIAHRFHRENIKRPDPTRLQEFLELPVVSNVLGRWLKVSERGRFDSDRRMIQEIERDRARTQIAVLEIIDVLVNGGALSVDQQQVLRDPYAFEYLNSKLPEVAGAKASQVIRRLQAAPNRDAQDAILRSIAE